jgi:hypothetical protein
VDGRPVPINFTMSHLVPAMGNASDMKSVVDATKKAEMLLLISQLVPFAFMLFMSFSMDKVWGLYLML